MTQVSLENQLGTASHQIGQYLHQRPERDLFVAAQESCIAGPYLTDNICELPSLVYSALTGLCSWRHSELTLLALKIIEGKRKLALLTQRNNFQEKDIIITAPYTKRVEAAPRTPNQGTSIKLSNNDRAPATRLLRATHFACPVPYKK